MKNDDISAWALRKTWQLFRHACETISREYAFLAQGVVVPDTRRMEAAVRKARAGVKRRAAE